MPESASSYSHHTDSLFYAIYWISVVMFVLIVALMIFFVLRFRHRPGTVTQQGNGHGDNHSHGAALAMELTWTIIPSMILIGIFYYGFKGFIDMATPPDYAYEIQITAYKWGWQVQYPNGATSSELHVPFDRPIKLILSSQDVIHSFYVPAFRIKKDVVPGRYNSTWFQAKVMPPAREEGENYYDWYCAEYCGTKHSMMRSKVFVHTDSEFEAWLENAANWIQKTPPAEAGKRLYTERGCAQCHSLDGRIVIGPTFQNVFGHEVPLTDGTKVIAEENYIRESIVNPSAKIVAGFQNVMPSFEGKLKDIEITALIEFLKTQSDKGPPPLKAFPAPADKAGAAGSAAGSAAPASASPAPAVPDQADKR